jgi:hypothetical protein
MFYSEPQFLDLTPEWKEKLDRFAEEHDGEELGTVADHVLFEDDKLRIWEMKLEPGEHTALHRHDLDYYLVIMSGDLVAGVTPKGSPVDSFIGIVPPTGNTVPVPRGGTEWAWNVGKETYHEILVEVKDQS